MRLINYLKEGGPTTIKNRKDYIYNKLKESGFSDLHASAIIGNLLQENSTLDPKQYNNQGSSAVGIGQWIGPRAKTLFNEYGKDKALTLESQVDFLIKELTDKKYFNNSWLGEDNFLKFKNSDNLVEATSLFSDLFERAGDHEKKNSTRVKYALNTYTEFTGNTTQYNNGTTLIIDPINVLKGTNNQQNLEFSGIPEYNPLITSDFIPSEEDDKEEVSQAQQELILRNAARKEILSAIPVMQSISKKK